MGADANIETIKRLYVAFGEGDVATILDALADDVDWASEAASSAAPWYGVRKDKAAVGAFFEAFGSSMEVAEFTPLSFAGNDTDVFCLVRYRATVRANGQVVEMNLHHYFVFDADSKISYYRGSEDTAQAEAALRS
jgi:ketosteroid isomerase-like protein